MLAANTAKIMTSAYTVYIGIDALPSASYQRGAAGATSGPGVLLSIASSPANDDQKKRPQADTRLGSTQLRRLLSPGDRGCRGMGETPG